MNHIEENNNSAYNLLHTGILALSHAEKNGINLDLDYCRNAEKRLLREIENLEKKIYSSSFYKNWEQAIPKIPNIYSGGQLAHYLYTILELSPAKTTKTGKGSTDDDALKALDIEELDFLLEIRGLKKIKDTYLANFTREQVDSIIHPFFNLHTVTTYRSSSDKPNFQNVPKRNEKAKKICRKALIPSKGHFLAELDYSSIEVRIAACYHKDPNMIRYLKDPTTDMHADMAKQLYMLPDFDKKSRNHATLRSAAKNGFVFPQFYGDYYEKCAISLAHNWGKLPEKKRWSVSDGIEIYDGVHLGKHFLDNGIRKISDYIDLVKDVETDFWYNRFPVYRKWKERMWLNYQKTGEINTLTGFTLRAIMGRNQAINSPIQGSAFHCLLLAFIELTTYLKQKHFKTKIIGQIHDAIVLDVFPEEWDVLKPIIKEIMCDRLVKHYPWINVPIEIECETGDIDESWYELEKDLTF